MTNGQSQIQLITWFLFVVAVLGVGARLGTKYAMTSKLSRDDWSILAALVCEHSPDPQAKAHHLKATYLAQCISISTAASNGLGQTLNNLAGELIGNAIKV